VENIKDAMFVRLRRICPSTVPRVAVAPFDMPAFLSNSANLIYARRDSLERFRPDSLGVIEFQTRRDYELAERIYNGHPRLGEEVTEAWNDDFTADSISPTGWCIGALPEAPTTGC
jgi:hypothetical protein